MTIDSEDAKTGFRNEVSGIANAGLTTSYKSALRNASKYVKNLTNDNQTYAIFLSDGNPFSLSDIGWKNQASILKTLTSKSGGAVYGVSFGTSVFGAMTSVASVDDEATPGQMETRYCIKGTDMGLVFDNIFNDITSSIEETINGSSFIDNTTNIIASTILDGKWICLKNNSECSFHINDDNTMEGNIDIYSTKIILKEGDTPKESKASGLTLVEWSNKGYIGKYDNYLYLNLKNFSASGEITVEIVQ